MPLSRRVFIKNSIGFASAGFIAPSLLLRSSQALAVPNSVIHIDPIAQARMFQSVNQHNANAGFDVAKATIILSDAPLAVHRYAAQELVD